jgi:hypothetical protein
MRRNIMSRLTDTTAVTGAVPAAAVHSFVTGTNLVTRGVKNESNS